MGLTIIPVDANGNSGFDSTITTSPEAAGIEAAIDYAIQFYESQFRNNVTLKVHFEWVSLGSGGAVASNNSPSGADLETFAIVKSALSDIPDMSWQQYYAAQSLPSVDPYSAASYVMLWADELALGITPSGSTPLTLELNSSLSFAFDPNNRAVSGEYDAIGAIEHELSEIMGRVGFQGGESYAPGDYTPMDLFRYTSPGVRGGFGPGYFSPDGTTLFTEYNNPATFGGDVVDWYPSIEGDSYGDSFPGVSGRVTPTDLETLNVIGWNETVQGDFVGTGSKDIVLENAGGGVIDWLTSYGGAYSGYNAVGVAPGYTVVGTGDYAGHGVSSILLENGGGGIVDWAMSNGQYVGYNIVGNAPGWNVVGSADMTGDGTDDVLLQNGATGQVIDWQMENDVYNGYTSLGNAPGWKVVGTGEFYGFGANGSGPSAGNTDVLLENPGGSVIDWMYNDGQYVGYNNVGDAAGWTVVGTGKFLAAGPLSPSTDVLLENNTTGELIDWYMLGGHYAGYQDIGNIAGSTVVGVGDYAGAGVDNILIENKSTGAVSEWFLNPTNGTFGGSVNVGSAPGWKVTG